MNVSIRALRYIVTASECRNVTEAARRLNISQSSISAAIAEAEASLNVQLFVRRHARGVAPTVAGLQFVAEARRLLDHADRFAVRARSLSHVLDGEIVVGGFLTLAPRFLPGLLDSFSELHPNISVRVEEGDQEELIEALLAGRVELALSYGFAIPPELRGDVLTSLAPHVIVAADHPLAGAPSVPLEALADEPFLLLDLPHSRDYFLGIFEACGTVPNIAFRGRSYELIRGLVGRNRGYTIHNALPCTPASNDGSLVAAVPLSDDVPPLSVMSLRLARQPMRPAVRAFAEFAAASFRPGGLFEPGSVGPGAGRGSALAGSAPLQ
jgi:DNA-binding transcriptional LysR family regulator